MLGSSWEEKSAEINSYVQNTRMRVLIWGPGVPSSPDNPEIAKLYAKREAIRRAIKDEFPFSEPAFSEDPLMQALPAYASTNLQRELMHSMAAELILMLDVTRGVDVELDVFGDQFGWFRAKAHVLLPKEFENSKGLVQDVISRFPRQNVHWFTQEELDKCLISTSLCPEIVYASALLKFAKML